MKKTVSVILALILVLSLGGIARADYGILVTRHPADGTCMEGEPVCFFSDAQFYSGVDWTLVDPCGKEYSVAEFREIFPYLAVEGEYSTMLTVRNPSIELNGWAVFCNFHSAIDNASTNWGFFHVSEFAVPSYNDPTYNTPFYY